MLLKFEETSRIMDENVGIENIEGFSNPLLITSVVGLLASLRVMLHWLMKPASVYRTGV
jgi:hypothetical protein